MTPTPDEPEPGPLLDPVLMRKLERLALLSRKAFAGRVKGQRRSPKRGSSIEFADYRDYAPGDDYRRIDWNAFARLDRLFVKLFAEEEDLCAHILLDGSRSMGFGTPTKLRYGRMAAAALAYMALFHFDRVGVGVFGAGLGAYMPPVRGRARCTEVLAWLESAQSDGGTGIAKSLREYAARLSTPGVALVISDLLARDWQDGLRALVSRRCEVSVLHVLAPSEVNPALQGDLKLVDAETGEVMEVTISALILRRYRKEVERFRHEVASFCGRYGISYLPVTTAQPFEDLVLNYLRRSGLVG